MKINRKYKLKVCEIHNEIRGFGRNETGFAKYFARGVDKSIGTRYDVHRNKKDADLTFV